MRYINPRFTYLLYLLTDERNCGPAAVVKFTRFAPLRGNRVTVVDSCRQSPQPSVYTLQTLPTSCKKSAVNRCCSAAPVTPVTYLSAVSATEFPDTGL